jgi:hypothetical protein
MGPDSAVGIAIRYGLYGLGIESRWGARFSTLVQNGPGAHPASNKIGTRSFPEVKRPERGVDHPSHIAPRLKKKESYDEPYLNLLPAAYKPKIRLVYFHKHVSSYTT